MHKTHRVILSRSLIYLMSASFISEKNTMQKQTPGTERLISQSIGSKCVDKAFLSSIISSSSIQVGRTLSSILELFSLLTFTTIVLDRAKESRCLRNNFRPGRSITQMIYVVDPAVTNRMALSTPLFYAGLKYIRLLM